MDNKISQFSYQSCKSSIPVLKSGYLVRVHQKIKEGNKERVQVFEGMIIKTGAGHGPSESFCVRKVTDGIGVEKTFLIHSPSIVKVDVVRSHKIRRSKLYYLRNLSGKALRLKEVPLKLDKKEFSIASDTEIVETKEGEVIQEVASEVKEAEQE